MTARPRLALNPVWVSLWLLTAGAVIPHESHAAAPEAKEAAQTDENTPLLPRYQLNVGEKLVYESSTEQTGYEAKYGGRDTVWVVARNDDGSHRLVVRHEFWRVQSTDDEDAEPQHQTLDETLAYLDLHPDGRFERNGSFGYRFDASTLFPRLAQDRSEVNTGWESERGRYGDSYDFEVTERPDEPNGMWEVRGERKGPTNDVYEASEIVEIRFDAVRGVIEQITRNTSQEYGSKSEGQGTQSLVSVEPVDEEWLQTFRKETERYFTALAKHEELEKRARHEYSRAEELMTEAFAVLKSARAETTLNEVTAQLDAKTEKQERYVKYRLENARKFEALIGQPSEDWVLEDLNGNGHALADYRGQVVLLDFWYRGCGWCIRAMPQVKQVTERFADRPVTVFGMNTDRELDNARFVEEAMDLNYTSLQATGIPEKYEVTGFPTLVILDRQGRIRDIHVGYADDLFEQVSTSVERLLEEPEQAEATDASESNASDDEAE